VTTDAPGPLALSAMAAVVVSNKVRVENVAFRVWELGFRIYRVGFRL